MFLNVLAGSGNPMKRLHTAEVSGLIPLAPTGQNPYGTWSFGHHLFKSLTASRPEVGKR